MGMSLSKVKDKVATATVLWDGETVDVGYRPGQITPALLEKVQGAAEGDDLNVVGLMLAPVLAWWDVLDDDGERLPTDPETIATIPLGFLMEVLTQLQEAMRPPASKG